MIQFSLTLRFVLFYILHFIFCCLVFEICDNWAITVLSIKKNLKYLFDFKWNSHLLEIDLFDKCVEQLRFEQMDFEQLTPSRLKFLRLNDCYRSRNIFNFSEKGLIEVVLFWNHDLKFVNNYNKIMAGGRNVDDQNVDRPKISERRNGLFSWSVRRKSKNHFRRCDHSQRHR